MKKFYCVLGRAVLFVLFLSCAALFAGCGGCASENGTEGSQGSGGSGSTGSPAACRAEITAPESLRYGGAGGALRGSCSCGKPVLFESLTPEVLEISEGVAYAVDLRTAPSTSWSELDDADNVIAYHESVSPSKTVLWLGTIRLKKGESVAKTHAEVTVAFGETPALGEGFRFTDLPQTLALGAHELPAFYNPDPEHLEDFSLTVRVAVVKKPAVPATHPEIFPTYREGLRLADLQLAEGFFWKEPDTLLHAGEGTFDATYCADEATEPFSLKIGVNVARGIYPQDVSLSQTFSCTYDESATLAQFSLPAGYVWKDPQEVPVVSKSAYAARFDAGADYLPVETQVSVRVAKKREEVVLPVLPAQTPFVDAPVSALLEGDVRFVWIEEDAVLHPREEPYRLTICWQKNENYELVSAETEILVTKAPRFQTPTAPECVYDSETDRFYLFPKAGEPQTEFSLDGETWFSETEGSGRFERLYYRFAETEDFLASETCVRAWNW